MYDINKRKTLKNPTVGDLIKYLSQLPKGAMLLCCGDNYSCIHVEQDGSVVCIDTEDLDECYEED